MMFKLEGERIVVRPLREDELELWIAGQKQLAREALPGGPPDRERLRGRIEESGTFRNGEVNLGIEAERRLIGYVQTYRPQARVLPPHVYEMGVALWDRRDRGKGYGTEAVQLFVNWLFDQGAHQVQGGAAVTNHAMRRVFEKLGFKAVGKLVVEGVKETLYGITTSEWGKRSPKS